MKLIKFIIALPIIVVLVPLAVATLFSIAATVVFAAIGSTLAEILYNLR